MMQRARAAVVGVTTLLVLLAAGGWYATSNRSSAGRLKRLTPGQFFTDPLQVRLTEAVDRGDMAGIDAAVAAGADVDARGLDGYALLFWAMTRGRVAGFEALVKHGADVTAEYRDPSLGLKPWQREVIIRLAMRFRNPEFLRAIFRQGFDPNHILYEKSGESLLALAARCHSEHAMQTLLDAGADINHQGSLGFTALDEARQCRDYKSAWFLLERGADPTIKDSNGHDFAWGLKQYGSRGVLPDHVEHFEKIVAELVSRGLLTRQDIVEADKPKPSVLGGQLGVQVIRHSGNSPAVQTILRLDRHEREAADRDRR